MFIFLQCNTVECYCDDNHLYGFNGDEEIFHDSIFFGFVSVFKTVPMAHNEYN